MPERMHGEQPEELNKSPVEGIQSDEIIRTMEAQEEVRNNTNAIESFLERFKSVKDRIVVGAVIAGTLIAPGASAEELSADNALSSKPASVETEKSDKQQIEKRVGFDLYKMAEKYGFETTLRVDNGTGRYILHIAQTHNAPDSRGIDSDIDRLINRFAGDDEILESQYSIINLLKELASKSDGTISSIFTEGLYASGDEANDKYLASLRQKKTEIENIDVSNKWQFVQAYKSLNEWIESSFKDKGNHYSAGFLNYFKVLLGKALQQKVVDLKESGNDELANFVEKFASLGEFFYTEENALQLGSVTLLALDGSVDKVLGAETEEANSAAMMALAKVSVIERRIKDAQRRSIPDELEILIKEYDKAETEFHAVVHEPRDDIAMFAIMQKDSQLTQQLVPLIYGEKHDFQNNVQKLQKGKFGLIDIRPRPKQKKDQGYVNHTKGRISQQ